MSDDLILRAHAHLNDPDVDPDDDTSVLISELLDRLEEIRGRRPGLVLTMADDLVARARALLAAATPGPWEQKGRLNLGNRGPVSWHVGPVDGQATIGCGERDAALIAAAPTLLAELLDRLEAAEKRGDVCDRLDGALAAAHEALGWRARAEAAEARLADVTGPDGDLSARGRLHYRAAMEAKGAAEERAQIVAWICDEFPGCDFIGHRIEDGAHLAGKKKPGD